MSLVVNNQHHRHILCHLVQTQGQGQTLEELTKYVKQKVKVPNNYEKLLHKIFAGACTIFVREFRIGMQSIKALLAVFKTAVCQDFEFAAKFLFVIDKCFQLWLNDCYMATDRTLVDDHRLLILATI